jgi:hypothetical protein
MPTQCLYDILGPDMDMTGHCSRVDYHLWEKKAEGTLQAKGYIIHCWWTGERDSIGPLSRCVDVTTPTGERVTLVYG